MGVTDYPKLHLGVRVADIDAEAALCVITSPAGTRWVVPSSLGSFLRLLDGTRSIGALQDILDTECFEGLSGCSAEDIIAQTAIRYGLLEGSQEGRPRSGSGRDPNLLKIPLFRASVLRPLSSSLIWLIEGRALVLTVTCNLILQPVVLNMLARRHGGVYLHVTWLQSLTIVGLVIAMGFIHELGHMAACERYQCEPRDFGVGLYLVFPVFWIGLDDVIHLRRRERVMVDASGIYLQSMAAGIVAITSALTGSLTLWIAACLSTLGALANLNPLFKMDGYWCLSDYLGIPNLHREARESVYARIGWLIGRRQASRPHRVEKGLRSAVVESLGWLHLGAMAWMYLVMTSALAVCSAWVWSRFWRSVPAGAASHPYPIFDRLWESMFQGRVSLAVFSVVFMLYQVVRLAVHLGNTARSPE